MKRARGKEVANKGLAKAIKRKMVVDEDILTKIQTRKTGQSLLMNPSRCKIFEYVCNFPCCHLRAISRAMNFSTPTARWHLGKLMEGGFISENMVGVKKIYTPLKDIIKGKECRIMSLLKDEDLRKVYLFIEKSPKSTQKKMCRDLKIYQQRLSRILLSLEKSGLIAHKRIGGKKAYSVTGKVRELKDGLDCKCELFEKALINALESDGVNPKIKGYGVLSLSIELDMGQEQKHVLKIYKNPLRTLLRASKRATP